MRTTVLTGLLVLGVSAGAAALTTSLIVDTRSAPEPASPVAASTRDAEVSPALDAEIRELREDNLALQQRLEDLEAMIAQEIASRVPIEAVDPRETPSSSTREAQQVAALLGDGGELPPAFVASVGQALKEIRDEEERVRDIERAQERAERIEQRLTELQEELGLSGYQTGEMRVALTTLEQKREELRQGMEADGGGDRREMFEGFRTLYEETSAQLQTILTPEQFELYQQSDRGRFGFGGRRGEQGQGFPGAPTGGR